MFSVFKKYSHWLHTQWPAGGLEKAPEVQPDGSTNLTGVRVVGDLTGVPLLKFSADTGAKAIHAILAEPDFQKGKGGEGVYDVAIIGSGVSGLSAAIEAKKAGLNYVIYEADESFATIHNFPRKKPIYTYPTEMTPAGELRFKSEVKEALLLELQAQKAEHGIETTRGRVDQITRQRGLLQLQLAQADGAQAQRVIVAIGRTGNFRKLNVPGEGLDKVSNRLIDATEFVGKHVMVVGGGDSALEAAISLAESGATVDLSYRKASFSRPKPENVEKLQALEAAGKLRFHMATNLQEINADHVVLCGTDNVDCKIPNDCVFTLIGREPPLDFFRKSGIRVSGDWNPKVWASFLGFFAFCIFLYHWKGGGLPVYEYFKAHKWFPFNLPSADSKSLLGSVVNAARDPSFYYSLAYCSCVVAFGIRRIKRRRTPYVKLQTLTLMAIQCIPLFILPYVLFPWMGANGLFTSGGFGQWFGDTFMPDGSYWRAFGFILAWPLFIWNIFTPEPIWGWLALSFIQTFVIIPLIVWRWGKGAYCGWICSCGALAETLGDAHRHKMPHGPFWNKLNMVGQVILALTLILFVLRVIGWIYPGSWAGWLYDGMLSGWTVFNYRYLVDLWIAGIIGVGAYFHFSGRVWCRFACPLAALMHIYARFSQYRIFSEKKKCISCNVCTTVCHQGIDVMNFANKGLPMEDPECVRCSACVQSCPTGVLSFGRYTGSGDIVYDKLVASPVRMNESQSPVDKLLSAARR
ncbi:MAG: NosR/NirI family nitrous oxide reductase transcriptional regulator [Lentimonas sp.]|jgi:NosR/NirI family nitrous oxide reductase transcriptional regulator